MNKPLTAQIDIESGKFRGLSGATYYIMDTVPAAVYPHFIHWNYKAHWGLGPSEVMEYVERSKAELVRSDHLIEGVIQHFEVLTNMQKAAMEFDEPKTSSILMACTCFCLRAGDQHENWSERVAQEYIEDWKHIDIKSFFLLNTGQTIKFHKELADISSMLHSKNKSTPSSTPSIKGNLENFAKAVEANSKTTSKTST